MPDPTTAHTPKRPARTRRRTSSGPVPVSPPEARREPLVRRGLTAGQIRELPATIDLVTAARALGVGRTKAYELARTGTFPLRVWKVGRSYRVCTSDLQTFLGLTPANAPGAAGSDRAGR
ncbi:helix-turn-helix domain-containing protein [Actinomadura logoneensis]|uniref:helix-turn-helix domain-containing protein n=1 Tax=Actinomadura logoneensis TaxID=2293572 RepID=UPI001F3086AA|nr:helix-turn-helix domain-containing protein [Actinomadura logoneensis]